MKLMISFVVLSAALFCSGCVTPERAYANKHPELTNEQRKIFLNKRVTDTTAVVGLTREQIHLALGEPAQYTKIDGVDAWVYLISRASIMRHPFVGPGGSTEGVSGPGGHGEAATQGQAPGLPAETEDKVKIRTTILFQGDNAVKALLEDEVPQE